MRLAKCDRCKSEIAEKILPVFSDHGGDAGLGSGTVVGGPALVWIPVAEKYGKPKARPMDLCALCVERLASWASGINQVP